MRCKENQHQMCNSFRVDPICFFAGIAPSARMGGVEIKKDARIRVFKFQAEIS